MSDFSYPLCIKEWQWKTVLKQRSGRCKHFSHNGLAVGMEGGVDVNHHGKNRVQERGMLALHRNRGLISESFHTRCHSPISPYLSWFPSLTHALFVCLPLPLPHFWNFPSCPSHATHSSPLSCPSPFFFLSFFLFYFESISLFSWILVLRSHSQQQQNPPP